MIKLNKEKVLDILLAASLFLIAFLWKYINADYRNICLDEPFTIFHAQESIKDILLLPTRNEPHPPLFMLILHFWIKLFGIGTFSVRAVPIFFNALTAVFLYFIGKRNFGLWSGIIASGLFMFSTYHFFIGGDTRAYSLLSCATAASLYFFFSTIRNPEKISNSIALLIANFFLVYSHYFGWFIVFMQFILSFIYLKERNALKRIWFVIAGTAIIYIPMFKILFKQFLSSSKGTWVKPPAKSAFIKQLNWFMNSGEGIKIFLIILGVGIIVAFVTRIKTDKWKDLLTLFLWWAVPYSLMFFLSEKTPMFITRYILFNSIGFYLFIGASTQFLYNKKKWLLSLAAVLILWINFDKMETGDLSIREIKKATNYVQTEFQNKSIVIIYPYWANFGFTYHFAPDLFKQTENYYSVLSNNHILPIWGYDDAMERIKTTDHTRLIFYQDNPNDPKKLILNQIKNTYAHVDSSLFQGGIRVDVFEKK